MRGLFPAFSFAPKKLDFYPDFSNHYIEGCWFILFFHDMITLNSFFIQKYPKGGLSCVR